MRTSVSDRSRAERGVTLLELLIVIAVVALAYAAVGNLLRAPSPARDADHAAFTAANVLRVARAQAIASGRAVAVVIDPADRRVEVAGSTRVRRLGDGVTLTARVAREASADGAARILFYPDGTSTGGRLTLAVGEAQRQIVVNWLTGNVYIE
jgi:general secretion pathway protein H